MTMKCEHCGKEFEIEPVQGFTVKGVFCDACHLDPPKPPKPKPKRKKHS